MRTVEEHSAAILRAVAPGTPTDVPLADADGLVLAADVRAALAVPSFDNSAMDGYAVLAADVAAASPEQPVALRVVADLPAGSAEDPLLEPGTCARIMTGAPVPRTADAVVPVEVTDGGTVRVAITAPAVVGRHVRRTGEDVAVGDLVLRAGVVLGAAQVAAAAATGHGVVRAYPRPRVAVVSTGSELVPPGQGLRGQGLRGQGLRRGLIPDSNSYLLAAAVRAAGCEAVRVGAVPDDAARLGEVLDALLGLGGAEALGAVDGLGAVGLGADGLGADGFGAVDAIVTSGGVSVGAYDVVKELLAGGRSGGGPGGGGRAAGEPSGVTFTTVAMQPGKPQGFGTLARADGARVPVFALPGNPVSAYVSFEVFVRPALQVMRGLATAAAHRRVVAARVSDGWRTPPGRRQYIAVVATRGEQGWEVRPAGPRGSGSHLAVTLAAANGLGIVDADVAEVHPGDTVAVMLTGETAPSGMIEP